MKRLVLQFGLLGLFSLLAVTLGASGQRAAYATGPVIGPSGGSIFIVLGTWQDSRVDLYSEISGAPTQTDILITDQSYLRTGWTVKIDEEHMCIEQLTEGGSGQPDHMIVRRACGGGFVAFHAAGAMVQAHTVTVDVLAQNVPGPDGLGGFEVHLTFPPETEYIKAAIDTTWLTSTGRTDPWCDSPSLIDGTWVFRCWTLNPTPNGPTGSGLVARVTVLPPQSLGTTTVSLAGSQLGDIQGDSLNATPADIRIINIGCPDANLDGKVTVSDITVTARTSNARGEDSLATISPSDSGQDVGVGGIDASATTLPVTSTTPFSAPLNQTPQQTIQIDSEQLRVTAIASPGTPGTLTVQRGINGTTAAAHTAGTSIFIGIGATDTTIPISQVGLLQVNDSIAIDAELMTVQAINPTPPTITVTRATLSTAARTHNAGAIIYRGTYPNGINGTYNYTWPRDPNHDYRVTVSDQTLMARVSPLICPAP